MELGYNYVMIIDAPINIKALSFAEKLLLVQDVWDELISTKPDLIGLSDSQKKYLDELYEKYKANPQEGSSWDEVKARIRKR